MCVGQCIRSMASKIVIFFLWAMRLFIRKGPSRKNGEEDQNPDWNDNDLFKVIQFALTHEFTSKPKGQQTPVEHFQIIYARNGEDYVKAWYQNNEYKIILKATTDEKLQGNMIRHGDLIGEFYHTPHKNGPVLLFTHLQKMNKIRTTTRLQFEDPARKIDPKICNHPFLFPVSEIKIDKENVGAEELDYIKFRFPKLERMDFLVNAPNGYEHWALQFKKATILDGSQIKLKDHYKVNRRYLEIYQGPFHTSKLNLLLKNWINMETDRKLEAIVLHDVIYDIDPFRGIQTKEWPMSQRGRFYPLDRKVVLDCKDGLDIRRNDGVIGTVLYSERKQEFRFIVWHKRLPMIPNGKVRRVGFDVQCY